MNYSGTLRLSMPDLSDYHLLTPQQKLQYEDLAGLYKGGGAAMATPLIRSMAVILSVTASCV